MKTIFKMLIFIFGMQLMNAQVFHKDSIYTVVVNVQENDKETSNTMASLVLQDHPEIVLSSFRVEAANSIEHIQVESLNNPELKDVDDIIRVDIFYSQPYDYTISQYILLTNEVESILLPSLVNIHGSQSKTETVYVFPNQHYGKVNKITKLEIFYKDAYKIETINVLQNYAWNDSDYGHSEHY